MFKKNYKKILILGIFVIFIGAVIAPNISGYDKNTGINFLREVPASLPLNDDYVNIYLKFDEGSGTNAGDSSGHDYDGTIYGATWVNGYYGKALDFDGVNDYLNLSSYAKYYLGLNKTDDMIVSFYFKSTSTSRGIIYSMCRGDKYGYNPGFHVGLAANGTIEVQVWRLNCGILTWSNNSYNDGEWHYAEVYYNGISANPIAYIFVDETFDSSYKHYVCDYYSDNFKYAQIGMNSADYDDFFDGVLDEFKIIKYPGGNDQVPPIIDGPAHGEAGKEYEYTFTTYDPEQDNVSILIDWGDGTEEYWRGPYASGEAVSVLHQWDEDNMYYIKAKSQDFWHDSLWSEEYPVKIGNVPPDPPIIDGPKCGEPGEVLTYTFVAKDYEEHDIYYYIEWGDGTTSGWFGPHLSGEEVTATHSWDTEGNYEIIAMAKDTVDSESDWSLPYPIKIGYNSPPDAPVIDGPRKGQIGTEYGYIFSTTDPDDDKVIYEIEWGDGTTDEKGPVLSGEEVIVNHAWDSPGIYIIESRSRDEFCGSYSEWSQFEINIPRNRALNFNLFEWLFERFPNISIILKYILDLYV